jgi:hypothetical protein
MLALVFNYLNISNYKLYPYKKRMSGNCHRKCPENCPSIWKMSEILQYSGHKGSGQMSEKCPEYCNIPDIFQIDGHFLDILFL